jgi:uncharacterized repeat protein (TIGR03803 family)
MRSEGQEITHRGRRRAPLTAGWWRRFGILCLQLCLLLATTAMVAPAQNEQDPKTVANFTTLLNFDGTSGGNPVGPLVQGTDGNLYGSTAEGGANAGGTVFKVTPGGTLTTIYEFCSQANCADGAFPAALVLGTDGNLYGITLFGGTNNSGTAFKITPRGTLTTLHNWCSEPNFADGCYGFYPEPARPFVQAADGNFYGVNDGGGPDFSGTFFELTPTGVLTTLYGFCSQPNCSDGGFPTGLIQATDGNFYGTTLIGGANSDGEVFKITPSGTLTILYSFCSQGGAGVCTDGASPYESLIQASDGDFYGTTSYGGGNVNSASCVAESSECGTIFKITPQGALTTVYNFCSQTNCADGAGPYSGLVQGTDGNFYGSTAAGGISSCTNSYFFIPGCGTVFRLTPGGALSTLHSFDSTDGNYPEGLFQATNGNFYGTTLDGATSSGDCINTCGTAFGLSVRLGPFVETVPTSGTVGEAVTILGNDLTDATHVRFNHTEAAFTVVSDTEIQTRVPFGATTGFVSVNRHGARLTSNVPFQVIHRRRPPPCGPEP